MMDSGSSGSVQSSSGGEDEYDSRAERRFSGFLNNPSGHIKANPTPTPATTHHPHSSSSIFDPFSNFFDPLPTTTRISNLNNLDDTHCPRNPIQLPAGSSQQPQSFMTNNNTQFQAPNQPNVQPPRGLNPTNASASASVRNPRKRTRASRRAPTTVLTTDTTNFRAMVQEFTGIPAPPFTPTSSLPRARLDLSSSPPYLLRPFPQKLSPFTSTTNSLLSPSSHFLLPKQNHPLPPISSIFNLPIHQPNINLLHTPLPEHLLLSGNVSAPNILPPTWGTGGGAAEAGASDQPLFPSMNGKYPTSATTKLNNNYSASSSSLDFHGDKASQNNVTTTRNEGIIESWICSSD